MVWLTGLSLVVAMSMIIGLLAIVFLNGVVTFWPRQLDLVEMTGGDSLLGVAVREEAYSASPGKRIEIESRVASGELPADVMTEDGRLVRRLYMVGNKEVLPQPFRWVDIADIASIEHPVDATLYERMAWGAWIGKPEAVLLVQQKRVPVQGEGEGPALEGTTQTRWGERRFERDQLEFAPDEDGTVLVRERVFAAEGTGEARRLFNELHPEAAKRRAVIEHIKKHDIGRVNLGLEQARLRQREAELRRDDIIVRERARLDRALEAHERGRLSEARLAAARERFDRRRAELDAAVEAAQAERERTDALLDAEYKEILVEIATIEEYDDQYRVLIRDVTTGNFAPLAQTRPDEPLRISQVVRAITGNDLTFGQRVGVYFSRWWEFVSEDPREANTEGGVFPVIFGTVMMTILLSIAVVPLGVIAALYLREYAKQGAVTSVVRIAVNNLAGVPSIVYGVFGLGFFCYTVGRYIDAGPTNPWSPGMWFIGLGGTVVVVVGAILSQMFSKPVPGKALKLRHKLLGWSTFALWFGSVALVVTLVATTPFFKGFFRAGLPTATFGTKGILWSSLTLALLTLPVVIVATEEAISAVPRSLREASFGCGASKWQTIRRIVLPRAAPGIMTGMILAMARGAGEVAPLMLVGAVKLAPELPFEPHFPFFHLERSFMHLGFHIYDLGFQSPDSEAARPFVWTTTLLLILIVALLNLTAIAFRARLRRRFVSGAF
ncbi:MAG: ABC transporter permease subunit [Phycisphaerales bacterium]|nr:MAG: ABC transporter permease subunit [Phycisphaerales bacterium]